MLAISKNHHQVRPIGTIVNASSSKASKKYSDEELINLIRDEGQGHLFSLLYERYSDKVFRKCISFVKDPDIAKDMVQDVLTKVYTQLHKFKGNSRFSTWLYAITYNYCVEYYRKNSRYSNVNINDGPDLPEKNEDAENEMLMDRVEKLKRALEKVSAEDKIILQMKYKEEGSIKELMQQLDISESAVKMRLARARKRVKQLITEDESR